MWFGGVDVGVGGGRVGWGGVRGVGEMGWVGGEGYLES